MKNSYKTSPKCKNRRPLCVNDNPKAKFIVDLEFWDNMKSRPLKVMTDKENAVMKEAN